ncbi:hypothetical protein Q9189_007556 [Teloschistes chrysophthalmus]
MHLFQVLITSLLVLLASAVPSKSPLKTTPKLERIFQSMAQLGPFNDPIPIAGGQRIVASVVNGSIASVGNKGITGVFKGGISVIDIVDGGAAIVNNVQTFGSTNDGTPFLVTESGIGNAADDFARLSLNIGGNFAFLQDQFIITEAALAADRKSVMTVGYLVHD